MRQRRDSLVGRGGELEKETLNQSSEAGEQLRAMHVKQQRWGRKMEGQGEVSGAMSIMGVCPSISQQGCLWWAGPAIRKKAGCREKSKDKGKHTKQFTSFPSLCLLMETFRNYVCGFTPALQISHHQFFLKKFY